MRLLVTGGRDFDDYDMVSRVLARYVKHVGLPTNLLVIHGNARGLDALAEAWCADHGVPCVGMPAPWPALKRAAGGVRNSWMLKWLEPTHCHVFPGGTGTADMKKKAVAAKLVVRPRRKGATVFVYGANEQGIHGAGAALTAHKLHGAEYGKYGRVGNSYGIPTKLTPYKSLPLSKIRKHVQDFLQHVRNNPQDTFKLTAVGCGRAGYTPQQIAPMFTDVPSNVVLPPEFQGLTK